MLEKLFRLFRRHKEIPSDMGYREVPGGMGEDDPALKRARALQRDSVLYSGDAGPYRVAAHNPSVGITPIGAEDHGPPEVAGPEVEDKSK